MTYADTALSIVKRLRDNGHEAYYAGGWVRDLLLGLPSDDIDIATNATPNEVMALFPKVVPVGLKFGSVIVVEKEGHFEVTTFRQDLNYQDGRHPEAIQFSSAEEDAKRRSFTINGMFYDPLEKRVIDFVGGQKDLDFGVIRAIGDPSLRFQEDRLRMIRALRFAARFKFRLADTTAQAIRQEAPFLFPAVAIERVMQEFSKVAGKHPFGEFLAELQDYGLLQQIFPNLRGVTKREILGTTRHLARFPQEAPLILYLLELFPKASLQERLALCERLKVSKADKQLVELLTRVEQLAPSDVVAWAHLYADKRSELLLTLLASRLEKPAAFQQEHAKRQTVLHQHIERIRTKTPLLSTQQLMEAGIQPGPLMGKLLAEAERLALINNLDDPAEVLRLLRQQPNWPVR